MKMNIVRMKNMADVRHNLSETFMALCDGTIEHKVACELNNNAGKLINSVKVDLARLSMEKAGYDLSDLEMPFLPKSPDKPKDKK